MPTKWTCQAYRGMDTFRQPVEVEAETSEEAAQKAVRLVPFGDMMQCEPIHEPADDRLDRERCRLAQGLKRSAWMALVLVMLTGWTTPPTPEPKPSVPEAVQREVQREGARTVRQILNDVRRQIRANVRRATRGILR